MNTIDISYDNNSYKALAPRKNVVDYLNHVLAELGLSDVEFSVSFIEEEHMRQLNMEFRSINDSTDILSFAAEDDDGFGFVTAGTRKRVLGDMLICPEVLKRRACRYREDLPGRCAQPRRASQRKKAEADPYKTCGRGRRKPGLPPGRPFPEVESLSQTAL